MKTTLLATSPTKEGILKCIASFYFGSEKELIEVSPKEWNIQGTKGILSGVRVILKGKRFRFEMIKD